MWGNPEVALRTPPTGPALRLQGTGLHHGLPWRATPQEVHVPPTPQPADGSGFKAGSHTAHPPSTSHPHTASCPARPWSSVRPALWRPSEGPFGDFSVLAKSSASCKPRAAASIRLAQGSPNFHCNDLALGSLPAGSQQGRANLPLLLAPWAPQVSLMVDCCVVRC